MTRTRLACRILGTAAVLALAAGAAGCSDTDERPATWSYISATIIQPNCATSRCHSEGSEVAGYRFDSLKRGYDDLSIWVTPGAPQSSYLIQLLRGTNVEERMPPDQPLPEGDIQLIEQWIQEGAAR